MEVNNFALVFGQGLVALLAFAFCALFYPHLFLFPLGPVHRIAPNILLPPSSQIGLCVPRPYFSSPFGCSFPNIGRIQGLVSFVALGER